MHDEGDTFLFSKITSMALCIIRSSKGGDAISAALMCNEGAFLSFANSYFDVAALGGDFSEATGAAARQVINFKPLLSME